MYYSMKLKTAVYNRAPYYHTKIHNYVDIHTGSDSL